MAATFWILILIINVNGVPVSMTSSSFPAQSRQTCEEAVKLVKAEYAKNPKATVNGWCIEDRVQ